MRAPRRQTPARLLAAFAKAIRWSDLPEAVRARARDSFVDAVGCAVFGSTLPACRPILGHARSSAATGPCTVLDGAALGGLSATGAALANGALAHAFELDSVRVPPAGICPGAVLTAAALAVAEQTPRPGVGGRELLTTFVAGGEVMGRVAAASRGSSERLGLDAPALVGVFGATIAAGRIMGLDAERLAHALGVAGGFCAGIRAAEHANAANGQALRAVHLGRAAESGVVAASLAGAGLEGPDTVLEGRHGFLDVFTGDADPTLLTAGLADEWETERIALRPYPCHLAAQTPVAALVQAINANGVDRASIQAIRLGVGRRVLESHASARPETVAEAQASVPWCLALAWHRNLEDPRTVLESDLDDAVLGDTARAIVLEPYLEADRPGRELACRVELIDDQGESVIQEADDFPGCPGRPLERRARRDRFVRLTRRLGRGRGEALFDRLDRVAECREVRGLFQDYS